MIRKATDTDIPRLAAMGERFHAMSPHKGMGEYDREAVARMLRFLLGNPHALVLTNGDGVIGGMMAPVYFNPAKTMMEESFWYAEKGGKDLLKAFCKEARLMGADYVYLSTLTNDRSDIIDRVVTHMEFRPVERRYVKELTQ